MAARVMPLVGFMGAALLLLSLAAIPARAVPGSWAVYALSNRREELAVLGLALFSVAALLIALFLAG